MPLIEITARFDTGELSTTMEAETIGEVIDRINQAYPKLELTTDSIISWGFVQKQQELNFTP